MTKEQAIVYLRFSGFSDEQIRTIEGAFSSNSENPNKSEWQQDHEILKAYSDGANDVIDKIKAEIEQAYCKVTNDYDHGRNYGLYIATQIIDRYTKDGE